MSNNALIRLGASVLVPAGTLITAGGATLPRRCEVGFLGKIIDITKTRVVVDPWYHGSKGNAPLANIPKHHHDRIQATDALLGFDEKTGAATVFYPGALPADGAREYYCTMRGPVRTIAGAGTTIIGMDLWARTRKEALAKIRLYSIARWNKGECEKITAHLKYKNQTPFNRSKILNQKA